MALPLPHAELKQGVEFWRVDASTGADQGLFVVLGGVVRRRLQRPDGGETQVRGVAGGAFLQVPPAALPAPPRSERGAAVGSLAGWPCQQGWMHCAEGTPSLGRRFAQCG